MFSARTYGEVIDRLKVVHRELKTLGCFSNVDITLDRETEDNIELLNVRWFRFRTSSASMTRRLFQVLVTVKELGRITRKFDVRTTRDGDSQAVASAALPNLFGRGESAGLVASRSWLSPNIDGCLLFSCGGGRYRTDVGRRHRPVLWRGLSARENYASLTLSLDPANWLRQELSTTVLIRDTWLTGGRANPSAALSAREQCGYSMKSSISQTLEMDTRDNEVLPRRGLLLRWFAELTGPLGNANFCKNDLKASAHLPVGDVCVLSLCWMASVLTPLGSSAYFGSSHHSSFSSSSSSPLAPEFALFRNPLQCRGWNHAPCAASEFTFPGHVGGHLLSVASSIKLSFPVPFLRGAKSWILQNTHMQLFCDYGAIGRSGPGFRLWDLGLKSREWSAFESLAAGAGIVLRLGKHGRAELNYCYPLLSGGVSKQGLQLGIGVDVL